jgi:hypothetical protein
MHAVEAFVQRVSERLTGTIASSAHCMFAESSTIAANRARGNAMVVDVICQDVGRINAFSTFVASCVILVMFIAYRLYAADRMRTAQSVLERGRMWINANHAKLAKNRKHSSGDNSADAPHAASEVPLQQEMNDGAVDCAQPQQHTTTYCASPPEIGAPEQSTGAADINYNASGHISHPQTPIRLGENAVNSPYLGFTCVASSPRTPKLRPSTPRFYGDINDAPVGEAHTPLLEARKPGTDDRFNDDVSSALREWSNYVSDTETQACLLQPKTIVTTPTPPVPSSPKFTWRHPSELEQTEYPCCASTKTPNVCTLILPPIIEQQPQLAHTETMWKSHHTHKREIGRIVDTEDHVYLTTDGRRSTLTNNLPRLRPSSLVNRPHT